MEREPREDINKEDHDLLQPLNVLTLGSGDDPCFGKLHDLKATECMECGDSEFCAIVMAQNLHSKRVVLETNQRFKDIEESDKQIMGLKKKAKELILEAKENGSPRMKTILVISRKLNLTKDIVKQLYDEN